MEPVALDSAGDAPPSICPYHNSQRKTATVEADFRPIEQDADGVWHLRSFDAVRAILRSNAVKQAGFQAEALGKATNMMRDPMLYLEGKEHIELRKQTARFFTPKAVKAYDGMIIQFVDEMLAALKRQGRADLSELSMKLAVRVAAQVVGLTNSNVERMENHIGVFFEMEPLDVDKGWTPGQVKRIAKAQYYSLRFFLRDVLPAVRARRKQPQDDLISHLLAQGYSNLEVMTECITFGAAGMVTTREFISAAAWHLLENADLRQDYLSAETKHRHEILHEILRLEPVVTSLQRRTTAPIELTVDGEGVTIPADALVELDIYRSNSDEAVLGAPTDSLCTHRELPRGVHSYGMSFGDGAHRCPGAYIAIEESDIFLMRFLQMENLRLEKAPSLTFNEIVKGYELRDFMVAVD